MDKLESYEVMYFAYNVFLKTEAVEKETVLAHWYSVDDRGNLNFFIKDKEE